MITTHSSAVELRQYLQKNPKKHIAFDLDWAILTLVLDWRQCINDLYKKLKEFDPEYMAKLTADDLSYELYNDIIKKHGTSAKKLIQDYYAWFEPTQLKRVDYNEDIFEFIKGSADIYQFYIWSSNQPDVIESSLEQNNSHQFFKKIVSAKDVMYFKPNPEGFEKYLFDPKTQQKSDWLMIGDSVNDEKAATNSGIDYFKLLYCTISQKI